VVNGCIARSADTCIASVASDCETKIPDGKYSDKTAQDCLDAVAQAYSDAKITADERDVVIGFGGACDKIISGSGGADDSCDDDTDCNRDEDLACVKKAGAPSGKCEKPNPTDNGASCTAADAVCGEGFYCDGKHCVEGGGQDAPCAADSPCTTNFRCVDASPAAAGGDGGASDGGAVTSTNATCQPLLQRGDICESDDECASQICILVDMAKNTSKCADEVPIGAGSQFCASIQ
jgi:hypothetical protein